MTDFEDFFKILKKRASESMIRGSFVTSRRLSCSRRTLQATRLI